MSRYNPITILWETISQNILHHLGYSPSPMLNYNFADKYAISIRKAVGAQSDIGWYNTLLGRLTPLWGIIQACY